MEDNENEFFDESLDPDKMEEILEAENPPPKKKKFGEKNGGPQKGSRYRATQKRIAYARALIDGKTQKQAYLLAFPEHSHWKPQSIDSHASAIFNDPNFQEIFEAEAQKIEAELEKQYRWSKGKAVQRLLVGVNMIAEDLEAEYGKPIEKRNVEKQLSKINTLKGLIAELNQMHGINAKNINLEGGFVVLAGEDDLED